MDRVMAEATARPAPAVRPGVCDFDEFCRATFHGLRSQLYAYLGDRAEAQDVVQEAFCRAFTKWKKISGYDEPGAWVRKVAWNLATSRFRKQRTVTDFLRPPAGGAPGPAVARSRGACPSARGHPGSVA